MKYVTVAELVDTIRKNLYKIPHDVERVVGIPRGGTLVGSIIAEYLNVPFQSVEEFIQGLPPKTDGRISVASHTASGKVLVVDDTVYNGTNMGKVKERLKNSSYDITYLVVYKEGPGEVDIYLEDNRSDTKGLGIVLYEWNVFNHYPAFSTRMMYDMDGVFCLDPPDERNIEEYEGYLPKALPLFIPKVQIGTIVTYRLEKYREVTEKWLKDQGVRYSKLVMSPYSSWEERRSSISPSKMKGTIYRNSDAKLFIESMESQAKEIACISGKPVLCVETNKLYR